MFVLGNDYTLSLMMSGKLEYIFPLVASSMGNFLEDNYTFSAGNRNRELIYCLDSPYIYELLLLVRL